MADPLHELSERVKALGSNWTTYTVVGSFLLYVVGYLTLRFHLTAIGVGTDLAVLDERYLFTGARFLVYLVASVPSILIVALPVALLIWAASRLLPAATRANLSTWVMQPTRLTTFGIVFAVLMIQLLMRQCFFFSNLLLARELPPEPAWLVRLLLDDRLMPLFFSALVAGCVLTLAILVALRSVDGPGPPVFARALLTFLAAVQILLLPINYGVLIVDKTLPRVAALGEKPLAGGEEGWLVWEGKDGVTFLVRSQQGSRRALITLGREDVKRTEIVGFDRIVPKLLGPQQGGQG